MIYTQSENHTLTAKLRQISAILALLLAVGAALPACSSMYDATGKPVEEIYIRAKAEFTDGDFIEAQRLFDIIKLQYPASDYADDAQYYLAEINFKRKEFILASYNYSYLRRLYPQSEYVKDAALKIALCYVELSPPFDRDQKYTREAIVALTEFVRDYPKDTLLKKAGAMMNEMKDKLAEREFRIAEQYRVLLSPKAALLYYDTVIDDYADTKFGELAFVGKLEVLADLRRYDEARSVCLLYNRFYQNGSQKARVEQLCTLVNNPPAAIKK